MVEQKQTAGLVGKLDLLQGQINAMNGIKPNVKIKPMKIPKLPKNKEKAGWVVVGKIQTNGVVTFKPRQINNNMLFLKENETYHEAEAGDILKTEYKGKLVPMILQEEWSLKPYSPRVRFEDTTKKGILAGAQKVIIKAVKESQTKPKANFNAKWLLIGLALIGVIYFIIKGGKFT
jgi:hypothetical protein